jgi:hypothetical protein
MVTLMTYIYGVQNILHDGDVVVLGESDLLCHNIYGVQNILHDGDVVVLGDSDLLCHNAFGSVA